MKPWIRRLGLALLVPILAACGGGTSGGNTAAPTTLNLFIWTDYIDEELVAEFEAEFNVDVVIDLYDSNEDMIAKLRAGGTGYDLVVPSDYAVQQMSREGLIQALDRSQLSNLGNIMPQFQNLYFDPEGAFSVPYFWGVTGIAYDTSRVTNAPTSWGALFDPAQLEAYRSAGLAFTMLDDPREAPGAALLYRGHSVNSTDAGQLEEAEALLLAQKDFVSAYDSSNFNLKLATEEIALAHSWSGSAAQALIGIDDKPGNPNIAFVVPQEGGVIFMDTLAIPSDADAVEAAHQFIDFLLRPEIAARNTDYVLFLTPNAAAEPLIAEETRAVFEAGFAPDAATIERLEWIERAPETEDLFSDLWIQVTGS